VLARLGLLEDDEVVADAAAADVEFEAIGCRAGWVTVLVVAAGVGAGVAKAGPIIGYVVACGCCFVAV
jgi:mannose/fructose/N-acetylgalactosamine-specific phosphotransferase system component IID